jgi:flagellar biosynthetic protein FliO
MNKLVSLVRNWLSTSTPRQKLMVGLLAFGVLSTIGLMAMTNSSGTTSDPIETSPFYFVGVFVKLVVVLLLIVASSMIFRRWMQPGVSGKQKRQVQLLETVRLSPKQALHLVSVGDQHLLIGATDQGISLINTVELKPEALEKEEKPLQPTLDFASLLQGLNLRSVDASSKQ